MGNIHHNFLIDNYSPQEGVDNDDGSQYYHTHDNFMVYGRQGLKSDFGGHDNHHFNNIYAGVGRALSVTGTLPEHQDKFYSNKSFFTPSGKVTVCGKSLAEAQEAGLDTGSSVATTPLDEEIIAWGKKLLGIEDQILV